MREITGKILAARAEPGGRLDDDDPSADLHQCEPETKVAVAASSPLIFNQAMGSLHLHSTDTANYILEVATRKLQKLPAR